jgi:site-specific DNA-methyltransferase (adenine-specific)
MNATIDLRFGDCLDILPTLPDGCADAIITDLPYGTTACKWDVIIPFDAMWKQVKRLCKGAFVTTASQPFTSLLVASNLEWFKYEWVWDKRSPTGFLNVKKMPMQQHNNVLVFANGHHVYNPQLGAAGKPFGKGKNRSTDSYGAFGDVVKNGVGYPKTILSYPRPNNLTEGDNFHPTQKPVALYEYLIKTYTNPGDTVLDFCAGSGTTLVAAIKTGRNAIGIEKERNYFEIAQRRTTEAQQMELV